MVGLMMLRAKNQPASLQGLHELRRIRHVCPLVDLICRQTKETECNYEHRYESSAYAVQRIKERSRE